MPSPRQLSRTPMPPFPCTLSALGPLLPHLSLCQPAPPNRLAAMSPLGMAPDGGVGPGQAVSSPSLSFYLCKVGPKGGGSCGGCEAKQGSFVDTRCLHLRKVGGLGEPGAAPGQWAWARTRVGCLRGVCGAGWRGRRQGSHAQEGPAEPQTQGHLLSRL